MCSLNTIYCISTGSREWHLYCQFSILTFSTRTTCLNVEIIMARQFLLMNGEKGRWRFVAIVNLSSVKWHLPNHVQAKENGEQGSWWCEKQHSRSEHPNPVLLKGESQLQIQHKRCFPTFCTCSQQMGGQVPLRERQTPTLHCKKMRIIWALKAIHDDALSPVFFFLD